MNEVYDVSVIMGLVDFIPVFLFGAAAVLLQRDLYNKMPKYAFACLAAGAVDAFLAGFFKALWKTLYAAGVCDFAVLNTLFMPLQSLGLLLFGFGIVLMLTQKRKAAMAVAAPAVFKGTVVFISMMVLGLGAACGGLSVLAAKMKKGWLIPIFVLTFFCYMGMGYLASRGDNSAAANWIEQGVNTLGEILLLTGTLGLHRAGLRDFKLQ
ncbi:MAG: hypothetical protein K6G17_02895 [Oscillospiraceae bacterium]|nr:hypothetical protein [Oscillospiraceae bacterium]